MSIAGAAGSGDVAFDIEVVPAPPIRWVALGASVTTMLVLFVIWRLRRR